LFKLGSVFNVDLQILELCTTSYFVKELCFGVLGRDLWSIMR